MACDNCPRKYDYSMSSNDSILDLVIIKKSCLSKRSPYYRPCNRTVTIIFIALLQVCLVVNCEALRPNENGLPKKLVIAVPGDSDSEQNAVISPSEKQNEKPSLFDSVQNRSSLKNAKLHLVKREASMKSTSVTGSNGTSSASSNSTSSLKSLDDKKRVVQMKDPGKNSKVVETLPGVAVNNTLKAKVSNNTGQATEHSEDDELGLGPPSGLKPDAILRLFYVFVVVGVIVLVYILIKFLRFRRKRATRKYRVLSHTDEQEMFPLAADDGDDEEIFNAADHQTLK